MRSEIENLRGKLPLYLNGRLPEKEAGEFEKSLKEHPELAAEHAEFSEIIESLREIEKDILPPSPDLFEKIAAGTVREQQTGPAAENVGIAETLRSWLFSPRVAWAVVAVQCVLIILLVYNPSGKRYETLSSAVGEASYNIVFREDARMRDVMELINNAEGTIVSGPSLSGRYVLSIRDEKKRPEEVLRKLRESGVVKFAERAY